MERTCEFCAAGKATVLCGADKAYLCLSCDAKVHTANALSQRHFRCLLCECCGDEPAHFRCLQHRMLLCHACNRALHRNNPKHQKRTVSSFTGSPSAKEFAILSGFEVDWSNVEDPLTTPSTSFHVEPANKQSDMIMQQILDLNRLQNRGVNLRSPAIRERESSHSSSSCIYNNLEMTDVCPQDGSVDDFQGLKEQHFDSPLSQSEYLFSYASSDPFWQSGTALEISKQYWPQNMEDERISEGFRGLDDLKMPEVDMSFPNFEELIREDVDLCGALLEDNSSVHKSENNNAQFKAGGNNTISTSKRQCKTSWQEAQRSASKTRR